MTATHPRPPRKRARRIAPDQWVSLRPNGIGLQKPQHYAEMARTAWDNRHAPRYAWRILSQGVCDGCALGVAGFHDWTIKGVHLCTTRLDLLKLNTMRALDPAQLGDVAELRTLDGAGLRDLGRLPYPMLRRHGEQASDASAGTTHSRWPPTASVWHARRTRPTAAIAWASS